jgi:branched-chain amino acid transport system substrate-binding protein
MVMIDSLLHRFRRTAYVSPSLINISLGSGIVSYERTTFGTTWTVRAATILAAVGLVFAVTTVTGCGNAGSSSANAPDKVIVIGGDFATSGGDASAGVPTQNGAQLAIEQEAKKGLPGGYRIESQMEDDTVNGVHDAAQGVRNVQTLLEDQRVLAIVGPQNSSVARAEIPVTNLAQIALVSPSATSIALTAVASGAADLRRANPHSNTFFRTVLRDDLQGSAEAAYAFRELHARRAYVIDDNESYGNGIADIFAQVFTRLGGTVIERSHLTTGQQDFIPLLTRVRGSDPDLVYYGGVVSTGGALLRRQMGMLGMTMTFMGGDGIKEQGFVKAAGRAADGAYCSDGAPNLEAMPSAAQFLKDYAARFPGQTVGTYSANAYVAAEVAIEAIRHLMEKNGGAPPTRAQVVKAIATSVVPDTPLGSIAFTGEGDVTTPVVSIWTIRQGQFVFIAQQTEALR